MKFIYPVTPENIRENSPHYLKGASNQTGYYPIGRMNTWHGGIHYEGDKPLKAIADGKIIAFRIPEDYLEETIDNRTNYYSNGFIIIEHNYKSPKGQEMTFYSLYNHLCSFKEMKNGKTPDIFKAKSYKVSNSASDTRSVYGVKIKNSENTTIAYAEKGTILSFLEDDTESQNRKVKYITPQGKEIIGYTFSVKFEGKTLVNQSTGKVLEARFKGSDGDEGARLREEAKSDAKIIQIILPGTYIEVAEADQGKTGWLNVTKVEDKSVSGYCHSSSLEYMDVLSLTESDLNDVKNHCIEVKAGDIIGYTGLNGFEMKEQYRGAHVEVFTHEEVSDFLTNAKGDGDENKNFAKLTEGTELKLKIPFDLSKNLPVKKTGRATEGFTEIEVDNLELVINNRWTELPDYSSSTKLYTFASQGDNSTKNQSALTEFNKLVDGIAQMEHTVKYVESLEGNQRRVVYQTPNKGKVFWVKNDDIEEKTLTFNIQLPPTINNDTYAPPTINPTITYTTETKEYLRLNKALTEVYIINPDEEQINTVIEADVIVNIKEGKVFNDGDNKKWYLLEPTGLQKTGIEIKYKGLISEDDLGEKFSAYNWSKFGFEVIEDVNNNYIYDFKNKSEFFSHICSIVDEDNNGILEPHELQRALNNHYAANKLSHLVCKHFNEWAYSGSYLSTLMEEVTEVFNEGIEQEEDEEKKNELETLKKERIAAFEAKVKQLTLWESIEARNSSYRTKFVKGALLTSPVISGGYYAYKLGKWIFEKITSANNPEKEIPLSPFPIKQPVVYHFNPVAFVEQMRRIGLVCIINRDYFYKKYGDEFGEVSDELKNDLEIIFEGIEKYETSNGFAFSKKQVAYILATIKHETGYFKPVIESYWSSESVRKKYYEDMYDPVLGKNETRRNMALNNENTTEGDGVKYAGKGYVQITWKKNYRKAKEKFDVDFVGNNALALVPKHSINIALYGFDSGMFTGKTIHDYINDDKCDYFNARRVINGTDAADTIKGYAEKFEKCLKIR